MYRHITQDGHITGLIVTAGNVLRMAFPGGDNILLSIGNLYFRVRHTAFPELANGKSGLNKAIPTFSTFPLNEFGSQFYALFQPINGEFIVTGRTGASGVIGNQECTVFGNQSAQLL